MTRWNVSVDARDKRNIHRAALEQKHGYNTKYAMHVIRLYLEAREYMETGIITLPNPNVDLLIAIRQGQYKLPQIEEMGRRLEADAVAEQEESTLPEAVDLDAITNLITEVYLNFWST